MTDFSWGITVILLKVIPPPPLINSEVSALLYFKTMKIPEMFGEFKSNQEFSQPVIWDVRNEVEHKTKVRSNLKQRISTLYWRLFITKEGLTLFKASILQTEICYAFVFVTSEWVHTIEVS